VGQVLGEVGSLPEVFVELEVRAVAAILFIWPFELKLGEMLFLK
jgi:hypothetical protein